MFWGRELIIDVGGWLTKHHQANKANASNDSTNENNAHIFSWHTFTSIVGGAL